MRPEQVLAELKAGNERFVAGNTLNRDLAAEARATADEQKPMAAVLGCIDSRVAPEFIFDTGIGSVFVARIAGNHVSGGMLDSLEFATGVAGAKVVVVLGHTNCGAIGTVCDEAIAGQTPFTFAPLAPAVDAVLQAKSPPKTDYEGFVSAVTQANVGLNVQSLTARSKIMMKLVDAGDLIVIGGIYDLTTRQVTFLDDGPDGADGGANDSQSKLGSPMP